MELCQSRKKYGNVAGPITLTKVAQGQRESAAGSTGVHMWQMEEIWSAGIELIISKLTSSRVIITVLILFP